jgi:hypothetical protein
MPTVIFMCYATPMSISGESQPPLMPELRVT